MSEGDFVQGRFTFPQVGTYQFSIKAAGESTASASTVGRAVETRANTDRPTNARREAMTRQSEEAAFPHGLSSTAARLSPHPADGG